MGKARSITLDGSRFVLDGKPFFIFSGEVHYFRMPRKLWKIHIEKAKAAGLNTISSYIPWSWHEYEEGRFDFEGKSHPQRDLVGFIQMAQDAGLYFSARVGPVSNAELSGEGLPDWLLKNNKDIFVQRTGVNNLPHAILLSYLNPKFQSFVKKWYDKVLPVVSARQVHKGGNIILVQLCNEIGMIHWLHKASDQSENVNRMYREFLKAKYSSIDALNRAYSTQYRDFSGIMQPEGDVNGDNLLIFFEWALFYRRYYAIYFQSLYARAKEHGINVPISANIPQFYDYDVRGRGVFSPMTTSLYRDFSLLAPYTVFGGAYQMRRLDFENFHDVGITSEIVTSVSGVLAGNNNIDYANFMDIDGGRSIMTGGVFRQAPVICAELQTGIMRDRPRLYPQDVDLNIKTSAAHGLNGLNCYMFSSGENISGLGAFGTYHDWQAPVSLDGTLKEHYKPLKAWGTFVKQYGSLLGESRKVTDTSLGFYLPYYATEYFSGEWPAKIESVRTAWFFDGFARLVQLAGYNFSISDIIKEPLEALKKRASLCVFSLDFMDGETQGKLAAYVAGGGKLVIGPNVPLRDLRGKPCTVLAEALGITVEEIAKKEMLLWNNMECSFEFPVQSYGGNVSKTLVKSVSGKSCAAGGKSGKGEWLAYGFGMQHIFDYQVQMAGGWLKELGIKPAAIVTPWDVQATLRMGDEYGFLFLFNYHDVDKKGKIGLFLDGGCKNSFVKSFVLPKRCSRIIVLKRDKNKAKKLRMIAWV